VGSHQLITLQPEGCRQQITVRVVTVEMLGARCDDRLIVKCTDQMFGGWGDLMRFRIAAVGAVALIASSCGGGGSSPLATGLSEQGGNSAAEDAANQALGDNAQVDLGGDGFSVSGTDASGNAVQFDTGTKVPDGFPMPIPDGAKVTLVSQLEDANGPTYNVTVSFDPSLRDEIMGMYNDWFVANGYEVFTGSNPDVITGDDGSNSAIVVYNDFGTYSEVTVNWGPQP